MKTRPLGYSGAVTDTLTKAERSRNMSKIRGKDTGPERAVRSLLHRAGYRFRLHVKDLPGKPILLGTTDKFLRQFGLHGVEELPEYLRYKEPIPEEEASQGDLDV